MAAERIAHQSGTDVEDTYIFVTADPVAAAVLFSDREFVEYVEQVVYNELDHYSIQGACVTDLIGPKVNHTVLDAALLLNAKVSHNMAAQKERAPSPVLVQPHACVMLKMDECETFVDDLTDDPSWEPNPHIVRLPCSHCGRVHPTVRTMINTIIRCMRASYRVSPSFP